MKNFFPLILLFLLQMNNVFSQTKPMMEYSKKNNRMNSFPFLENLNSPHFNGTLPQLLDQAFDSITALTDLKGANAAMVLPDGSIWKRAHGIAEELPEVTPLTTDHLMGMASVTKSFIAVTMLRLQEQNMLDLDDTIGQYLPAYPNISGAATIRQLLGHRTGFNDYIDENPETLNELFAHLDSIWTIDTLLSNFVLAPNFALGSNWSYSNTNYLLAGRVIEIVTGKPWYEVVREQVLIPLGLTHTYAYPWESIGQQPYAHAFFDLDGDGVVDDFQGNGIPADGFLSLAGTAGSYSSNPEDLVKFSERIYGGHFLSAASLAEMQTDYVQDGLGHVAGLGTFSFPNAYNLESWGHDGDLVYKSSTGYFPAINIALAVQQNDNRYHEEGDPNSPAYDAGGIYNAMLDAYIQFSQLAAVSQLKQLESLTIFPNPCSSNCKINFPEKSQLSFPLICKVTNGAGKVVFVKTLDNRADELTLQGLQPGLYVITAAGFSGKIIVE